MISSINKFKNSISIELKTIIGIIVFTVFIVGIERYQISQTVMNQFIESKKSKNLLLINTIAPIISVNMSLGLYDANKEYLDYIATQYSDIELMLIKDTDENIIYTYGDKTKMVHDFKRQDLNFCNKIITDSITKKNIGILHIHFANKEYDNIVAESRNTTIKVMAIALLLLLIFIILIRDEFKYLNRLTEKVLDYDPKLNNFPLEKLDRKDEVGIINDAIVSMVEKIEKHTHELDEINLSLEEKIHDRTKELKEANQKLKSLSVTDDLTQLANRRYFEEYYHKSWELAKRKNVPIAVIMCDIDWFKQVNDTHGHQAGDFVLQKIAKSIKYSLKRESDFVARYGGEEFIIVLYDADEKVATDICLSIQKYLKENGTCNFKGTIIRNITMSFGLSSKIPKQDDNEEILIKNADSALYKAKANGRNRIESF